MAPGRGELEPLVASDSNGISEQPFDDIVYCVWDLRGERKWYGVCLVMVIAALGVNYGFFFSRANSTVELVVFHVLYALIVSSWIQTIITHPGVVPPSWSDRIQRLSEIHETQIKELFDFNAFHKMWKPPRSHNDRVTQRLVLNMDHFCPWVMNTVGFYNRKFFILFLMYTWMALVLFLEGRYESFNHARDLNFFTAVYIADVILCFTLFFFWGHHMWLILSNSTTVEQQARFPTVKYDIGYYKNLKQVLGKNPWFWLLPVWGGGPEGNGIEWPTCSGQVEGRIPALYTSTGKNLDNSEVAEVNATNTTTGGSSNLENV